MIGCGSDTRADTQTPGTGGAGVGDAAAGTGGAGAGLAPVRCGTQICTTQFDDIAKDLPASLRNSLPAACCLDVASSACGVKPPGGTCMALLAPDSRCPGLTYNSQTFTSCCTAAGMCGLDFTIAGLGCLDLASPTVSQVPMAPAPRRCDGTTADGGDRG